MTAKAHGGDFVAQNKEMDGGNNGTVVAVTSNPVPAIANAAPKDTGYSGSETDDDDYGALCWIKIKNDENQTVTFQVISNRPDGNCMFRAISQALLNDEDYHLSVRQEIVEFIASEVNWSKYYPFIRGQHEHLIPSVPPQSRPNSRDKNASAKKTADTNANATAKKPEIDERNNNNENMSSIDEEQNWKVEYKKYMLQYGIYGTLQELEAASERFEFNLVILRELGDMDIFSLQTFREQVHELTYYFLFTGNSEEGHFELLQPDNVDLDDNPVRIMRGDYKTVHYDKKDGSLYLEERAEYYRPEPESIVVKTISSTASSILPSLSPSESKLQLHLSLTMNSEVGGRSETIMPKEAVPEQAVKMADSEKSLVMPRTGSIVAKRISNIETRGSSEFSITNRRSFVKIKVKTLATVAERDKLNKYGRPRKPDKDLFPFVIKKNQRRIHPMALKSYRDKKLLESTKKPSRVRVLLRQIRSGIRRGAKGAVMCLSCLFPC